MGNHEFNALAYHYELPDGKHLREHNLVHTHQHSQTLLQLEGHDQEWQSCLEWFYTLPLFLDLSELKVIHACWDQKHIDWLRANDF